MRIIAPQLLTYCASTLKSELSASEEQEEQRAIQVAERRRRAQELLDERERTRGLSLVEYARAVRVAERRRQRQEWYADEQAASRRQREELWRVSVETANIGDGVAAIAADA